MSEQTNETESTVVTKKKGKRINGQRIFRLSVFFQMSCCRRHMGLLFVV